jgi:hypothetical protein
MDDVDEEYARLQNVDDPVVDFVMPPTSLAWGNHSIYLSDPDGNLLLFLQPCSLMLPTSTRSRVQYQHAQVAQSLPLPAADAFATAYAARVRRLPRGSGKPQLWPKKSS